MGISFIADIGRWKNMTKFIGFGLWILVVIGLFFTVKFTVQSLFDYIILVWVSGILVALPILSWKGDK